MARYEILSQVDRSTRTPVRGNFVDDYDKAKGLDTSANVPYCETECSSRLKSKLIADTGQDEEFGVFVINVIRQKEDEGTADIAYPLTCLYCERGCYASSHWLNRTCRKTRTTAVKLNDDLFGKTGTSLEKDSGKKQ
uniref:Reverse transcriptase domain-containing protein n=1 Tax=Rhabditophanes sp. KR3021 TaxID=114890 RepID=A0AC35TNB1_9BILA